MAGCVSAEPLVTFEVGGDAPVCEHVCVRRVCMQMQPGPAHGFKRARHLPVSFLNTDGGGGL